MADTQLIDYQESMLKEFNTDSAIIGAQTTEFLKLVYPSYLVDKENLGFYRLMRLENCW